MMTNGFRKLQSPPLGGAIPSAVSQEEADTLEHRETVQGTSLQVPSPYIWMSSTFSASPQLLNICLCPCNSKGCLLILMPWSCSSTYLCCWSCAVSHGANSFNFSLMCRFLVDGSDSKSHVYACIYCEYFFPLYAHIHQYMSFHNNLIALEENLLSTRASQLSLKETIYKLQPFLCFVSP